MLISPSRLPEVLIIEPVVHGDSRGWFCETYSRRALQEAGIDCEFVQDNQSYSARSGTLRGLHFQNEPHAQAKLVRCSRGALLDVAVDIRKDSPRYGQWVAVELSAANHKQLYIPRGFAHGFLTLTDDVEIQYKVDDYYAPAAERTIRFDDAILGIDWGISQPFLSARDAQAPGLTDCACNLTYAPPPAT